MKKVFVESFTFQKSDELSKVFYGGNNHAFYELTGLVYEKRKIYTTPHLFKIVDEKKFLLASIKYDLTYEVVKDNRVKYKRSF